jgi:hypothetical protein
MHVCEIGLLGVPERLAVGLLELEYLADHVREVSEKRAPGLHIPVMPLAVDPAVVRPPRQNSMDPF